MCVMCQRGGPMNGRGMKGRKEDGPAVEESRCVRSIPIVYTYRTWRRRLSWVCPISRAQHPAFVSCVLSLFLSRTCLYRSLAFPCPWSIPSKGHRTSGFIKPSTGKVSCFTHSWSHSRVAVSWWSSGKILGIPFHKITRLYYSVGDKLMYSILRRNY